MDYSSHSLLVERVQVFSSVFGTAINAALDDMRDSFSNLIAGELCC